MQIYKYVKAVRDKTGLSQQRFAPLVGCNRAAIANYENNRAIPPGDVLLRIQKFETTLSKDKSEKSSIFKKVLKALSIK